jgi:hypothetical protein
VTEYVRLRELAKKIKSVLIFTPKVIASFFLFLGFSIALKMPVFVRTVTPFLRTVRSALYQGNAVSPLQHALHRQNRAQVNACRAYAAVFERTKPHVNIGMQLKWSYISIRSLLILSRYNWPCRSWKGTEALGPYVH